ncbi:MAG: hypothetical protein ACTSWN_00635 [Promethearchaeota archaeon]
MVGDRWVYRTCLVAGNFKARVMVNGFLLDVWVIKACLSWIGWQKARIRAGVDD